MPVETFTFPKSFTHLSTKEFNPQRNVLYPFTLTAKNEKPLTNNIIIISYYLYLSTIKSTIRLFRTYVILHTLKPSCLIHVYLFLFRNYVILHTLKPDTTQSLAIMMFRTYVILHTLKPDRYRISIQT